jgi:hypothetical protein
VIATTVALCVAGCGTQSLSAAQLRAGAERTCSRSGRRLNAITPPQRPSGAEAFLSRGIAVLESEVTALARLTPPSELEHAYGQARSAAQEELHALRSSLKGLTAGNDPVVAIKTLHQELRPLERRSRAAWRAVGVAACADS